MTAFRRLSRTLAKTEEGSLWFECPGCEMVHRIMHGPGAGLHRLDHSPRQDQRADAHDQRERPKSFRWILR